MTSSLGQLLTRIPLPNSLFFGNTAPAVELFVGSCITFEVSKSSVPTMTSLRYGHGTFQSSLGPSHVRQPEIRPRHRLRVPPEAQLSGGLLGAASLPQSSNVAGKSGRSKLARIRLRFFSRPAPQAPPPGAGSPVRGREGRSRWVPRAPPP